MIGNLHSYLNINGLTSRVLKSNSLLYLLAISKFSAKFVEPFCPDSSFLIILCYMQLRFCLCSNFSLSLVKCPVLVFLTSFLEYNCFTVLCQFLLYNKVNQLYVYICPYIPSLLRLPPTLPIPPLQVDTKHRADLPVLCDCFPLAIYFTFGSVYMSI